MEDVLRGKGDRAQAADLLAAAATRPWFPMAYLYPELPSPADRWHDMDHDPEPTFAAVSCPTLLMYGADEECVPAAASKAAWLRAAKVARNPDLTIVDPPGCGHFPATGEAATDPQLPLSEFSRAYTEAIQSWFASRPR